MHLLLRDGVSMEAGLEDRNNGPWRDAVRTAAMSQWSPA